MAFLFRFGAGAAATAARRIRVSALTHCPVRSALITTRRLISTAAPVSSTPAVAAAASGGGHVKRAKSRPTKQSLAAANAASAAARVGWEVRVGIEMHAQVIAATKLFSGSSTAHPAPPNAHASFIDAAFPGTLPALNAECVRQAVTAGLALNGTINRRSHWERKHYFYSDLPHGFQITQQDQPIVTGGYVTLDPPIATTKPAAAAAAAAAVDSTELTRRVRIARIQLEMDSGKSLHDLHPTRTFVDLNRAGMALLEIVSEPDMRSVDDASRYVRKLSAILKHIGVCSGVMETGAMRCDVNVSVCRTGGASGQRVEVKNVPRLRFITRAIEHEIDRQIAVLNGGGTIERETRVYDAAAGVTHRLRSKEQMLDYRFFPEPNLPPLILTDAYIDAVRASLPELPDAACARLQRAPYSLGLYDATIIAADPNALNYFARVCAAPPLATTTTTATATTRNPQKVANWQSALTGKLTTAASAAGRASASDDMDADDSGAASAVAGTGNRSWADTCPVSPLQLAAVIDCVESQIISADTGSKLLDRFIAAPETRSVLEIVDADNLRLIRDRTQLAKVVADVMAAAPKAVSDYRLKRDTKSVDMLFGRAMRSIQQRAIASELRNELMNALDKPQ